MLPRVASPRCGEATRPAKGADVVPGAIAERAWNVDYQLGAVQPHHRCALTIWRTGLIRRPDDCVRPHIEDAIRNSPVDGRDGPASRHRLAADGLNFVSTARQRRAPRASVQVAAEQGRVSVNWRRPWEKRYRLPLTRLPHCRSTACSVNRFVNRTLRDSTRLGRRSRRRETGAGPSAEVTAAARDCSGRKRRASYGS
jgi:hypothetical protein